MTDAISKAVAVTAAAIVWRDAVRALDVLMVDAGEPSGRRWNDPDLLAAGDVMRTARGRLLAAIDAAYPVTPAPAPAVADRSEWWKCRCPIERDLHRPAETECARCGQTRAGREREMLAASLESYDWTRHCWGPGRGGSNPVLVADWKRYADRLARGVDGVEMTTDGGWPRCGWSRVVGFEMRGGVPSVCLAGMFGASWHSLTSIGDMRETAAPAQPSDTMEANGGDGR